MAAVTFRAYAELNDFLPPARRQAPFLREVAEGSSVKDAVEALGIPHTEVDLLLVNGEPAGFERQLHDGDRVAIYPVFEALDIANVTRVRPQPLRVTRFVLDTHLGKLARLLRLLGFDTRYTNDADDAVLAAISRDEHRILLTRDRGLLKRRAVTHGYLVRDDDPRAQAREVVHRFDLTGQARPFTRCLRCNGLVEEADRADVLDQLEPLTREHYDEFRRCRQCGRVYWRGSHHARLERIVADALAGA